MELDKIEHRGERIARNTLMLYVRMFVLMLVGLYTSRVVLAALGETDYGIYNVIGGVVAMFTIISGALNSSVSRFITFEMGKGEAAQLQKVYSTAVIIQLLLSLVVVLLAEPAGLWFIENKMTIDPSRIPAARWVLHFSVLAFVINLMSVPQMASITAHEKMSAYAYVGVLDGLLRLGMAFLIAHSPIDRLIFYSALMAAVMLIVRMSYGIYCRSHFPECRFRPEFDRPLVKEMFSFAGWNFIGVTSGVLREHGGNILVNIFSGPAVNAARGVAVQLNGAVQGFVTNFMTAVNPQITKSYAAGDEAYLFPLLRRSSRMSFYLLFMIALPVLFNTEYLLGLWLKEVPDHTMLFVQLFLVFALSESLSNPLITVMLATGRIRNYQLAVGGLQLLNVPVSYVCLRLGAMPEVTVIVAVIISQICFFVRLIMLRRMIRLDAVRYIREVYLNVFIVAAVSLVFPVLVQDWLPASFAGFCIGVSVSFVSAVLSVLFIGCSKKERREIKDFVRRRGV